MERLEALCYMNLVVNIQHFTPDELSHLPAPLRQLLLTRLPAVDVIDSRTQWQYKNRSGCGVEEHL